MPPITKITKEDIIEAAFLIVKNEGIENLNARAVAKNLNCSVQPIFHKFVNMDDLKKEVLKKVIDVYQTYLLRVYDPNVSQYKNMGIGYIKFAKEDTKLFQILFMSEHEKYTKDYFEKDGLKNEIEKCMKKVLPFDKNEIESFHSKMWIFTHGLATIIATKTFEFSDDQIRKLLSEMFIALSLYEEGKKNEKNN